MTPYRRPESQSWYIRPYVPTIGRIGPWSTGTKDARLAGLMESMVKGLPLRGHVEVVYMLIRREVTLLEVWVADLGNNLDQLVIRAQDPLLANRVEAWRETVSDERVRSGGDNLVRLCEAVRRHRVKRGERRETGDLRVSWLCEPRNVLAVLQLRESEGLRRNSVRRGLYRAISDFLLWEVGRGKKEGVMSEVRFSQEDDERRVNVSPAELRSLLDAIQDPVFKELVTLAVTSGIDRSPILRITPRHLDEPTRTLQVIDGKTKARARSLELSEAATAAIRRAIVLRRAGPNDRVFPYTEGQVRGLFEAARKAVGLDDLRFKDLRGVFATAYLAAGGQIKDLQAILGHADVKMTLRYVRRLAVRRGADMNATADYLGIRHHLRIEEAEG